LRFALVLLSIFAIVGNWDRLVYLWQHWVIARALPAAESSVSATTEFFCPMCPGVHSAWPSPCPVCNMPLVRRTKGEMGILPDGSLARMQISPYRLQLGGIATARVEYRDLAYGHERCADLEPYRSQPRDAPPLEANDPRTAYVCPQHPHVVRGKAGRCPLDAATLQPIPLATNERLEWQCPLHPQIRSRMRDAVCPQCADLPLWPAVAAYAPAKMVLAVPASAVIDTGEGQVVFVRQSPGIFDAVRVEVGQPTGGYCPVISALARGADVVAQSAFLLDAETRLNPDLAATYFGAGAAQSSGSGAKIVDHGNAPKSVEQLLAKVELSPEERAKALRQRVCPITKLPLGSMGAPVPVMAADTTEVLLCCEGCRQRFNKQHANPSGAAKP
jgi:hypothetical protein